MPKSISRLKQEWLADDRYRDWVRSGALDAQANCDWCKSQMNISAMGVKALDSHMEGKKHKSFVNARADAKVVFSGNNKFTVHNSYGLALVMLKNANKCKLGDI